MPNKIRWIALTILLPLAFPCLAGAQPAAPDPLVRLTPAQASSFVPAFTALAQQGHVLIVAEDQPLHLTLTAQAARLTLTEDGEPLSALLPKLAAAYDYDVEPSGKAFLLKKRYTDAADLPSVTVKECALGLEEADRYAENFNPHFPNDAIDNSPAIKDLVYSLTPQQLEAMGSDKGGVPVASLAPAQQQEVEQFVSHLCVQKAIRDLPAIVGTLNRVCTAETRFGWRSFPEMNVRLFGYDAPFGYMGFLILSKPNQVKVHGAGGMEVFPEPVEGGPVPTQKAMWLAPAPDPTDPPPTPANAPRPTPPVSSSLGEIAARLNVRAADGLKVSVEPYLSAKRATAFGEEAATPRQELGALADVYGLRVLTEEKEQGHDRLRLTRLTASVPLNLISLHDSILQALPGPLVRTYRMHPTFVNPSTAPHDLLGVPALRVYAVRRIRAAVEPRLRASKDGRVALSALSEQEGRALAMTLMLDAMDSLGAWVRADPPDVITRFSELRLGGGLYDVGGKKQMSLMVGFPNPNVPTNFIGRAGVGEINYDPVKQTL